MIVTDASAILEILLRTEAAPEIENRIFGASESLHAPHLIDLEIAQVVRRYCRTGDLDSIRGSEMLADAVDLPIYRYPHQPFLQEIWQLREHLTAYDAAYVVLARALDATLVTRDRKLAQSPLPGVRMELL